MAQKLGKVAKKLKNLLPLKKRKRPVIWSKETPQLLLDYYCRPTSTFNYQCPCSSSSSSSRRVQPSAPPLPSWIESDMDQGEPKPGPMVKPSSRSYHMFSYFVQKRRRPRERLDNGFFGCVMSFTMNMLTCFCPCFRVTEAP